MFDDDEAFPNSERLFKEAFADTDPVPLLFKLLKEHETFPVICKVVNTYIEENPFSWTYAGPHHQRL